MEMGGHQHGEGASSIAIRTMSSYIIRKFYTLCSPKTQSARGIAPEIMQEAPGAHRAITKQVPEAELR